jgi:hypothetical protein
MSRAELLQAWARYRDGALPEAERQALVDGLQADGEACRLVLADAAIDGLLRCRIGERESGERFVAGVATVLAAEADQRRFASRVRARVGRTQRPRRAPQRQARMGLAMAAGLAVLAVAWWLLRAPAPDLPWLGDSRLAIGERVNAVAPVQLRWDDGSHAQLAAGTVLTCEDPAGGKRLQLTDGELAMVAAHQPDGRPLRIAGPHATATVVGTEFALRASSHGMRLQVHDGSVRLAADDGAGLLVAAGAVGLADRFGIRAAGDPIFAWHAGTGLAPTSGRRGAAPDGSACLVAVPQSGGHVTAMSFWRPSGLFPLARGGSIVARVWIGADVRWAGFYAQDYQHGRSGQWHLPLDRRERWCDLRFALNDIATTNGQLPQPDDPVHIFMLQAMPASAHLLLAELRILPSAD